MQFAHQEGLSFKVCRETPKMLVTVDICDYTLFNDLSLTFDGLMYRIRNASLLKELDIYTDEKLRKLFRLHFQNPDLDYTGDSPPSKIHTKMVLVSIHPSIHRVITKCWSWVQAIEQR